MLDCLLYYLIINFFTLFQLIFVNIIKKKPREFKGVFENILYISRIVFFFSKKKNYSYFFEPAECIGMDYVRKETNAESFSIEFYFFSINGKVEFLGT